MFENPKRTLRSSRITLLCALLLSSASAYTTVSGMYQLYWMAGAVMILFICTGIEIVRIASIYYLSLYWKVIGRYFRCVGLFVVLAACGISAIGTSSFFLSAYNKQINAVTPINLQIEAREGQIRGFENENISLREEIARLEAQVVDLRERTAATGEEPTARQTQALNDMNFRINQANNRARTLRENEAQIRNLRTEIANLGTQSIETSPELSRLVPIGRLFGISDPVFMITILTILLIIAFDPAAVYLMIFSTRLRKMVNKHESDIIEGNQDLKTDIIADMGLSSKIKQGVATWFTKKKVKSVLDVEPPIEPEPTQPVKPPKLEKKIVVIPVEETPPKDTRTDVIKKMEEQYGIVFEKPKAPEKIIIKQTQKEEPPDSSIVSDTYKKKRKKYFWLF